MAIASWGDPTDRTTWSWTAKSLMEAVAPTLDDSGALRAAYEALLGMGLVPKEELDLVDAWNAALDDIRAAR